MSRVAPLACVLALLAPAAAIGQTTPDDVGQAPPLVPRPPVAPPGPAPEPDGPGDRDDEDDGSRSVVDRGELPDTGADARMVALLGAGLLLSGVGLRLRTTDDRF